MKSVLTSWTIWFGLLQLALGVVGLISGLMDSTAAFGLIVTGSGTIGLRFKTTSAISFTPPTQ